MAVVLGIDLGTSSIKAMLLDTEEGVIAAEAQEYPVDIPSPRCAQQDPRMWWEALKQVFEKLRTSCTAAYEAVSAVGFSGQMHGLVLVDSLGNPVRPAIIWLDQRTGKQVRKIEQMLPEKEMGRRFCNRVSSGFAFPSLLWVQEMEPEIFRQAAHVLCPKDYIRMKITGQAGAEVVDASSTGMFSTAERDWDWEILDRFGLPKALFPGTAESMDVAGEVTKECAEDTGLPEGIPVIFGSGDQPAQSIGNGVVREGKLISNIGTGGQISAFVKDPVYDEKLRTNTFCHAIRGSYTIFGATLCSGMSLNWAKNKLFHMEGYPRINEEAGGIRPGAEGLLYLPYLSGERTPHMNPDARGMFFGMTLGHERGHFLRAVMEGVAYSFRDCLEILNELGVDAPELIASGGGAASEVWLQIQADILQKRVCACTVKEQACLGSCILAAAGAGKLISVEEGCQRFVTMQEKWIEPKTENRAVYEEGYKKFRKLYQRTRDLME